MISILLSGWYSIIFPPRASVGCQPLSLFVHKQAQLLNESLYSTQLVLNSGSRFYLARACNSSRKFIIMLFATYITENPEDDMVIEKANEYLCVCLHMYFSWYAKSSGDKHRVIPLSSTSKCSQPAGQSTEVPLLSPRFCFP